MIHYHGTPMTPELAMVKSFKAKHAMVSFEEPRQVEVAAEICQSIVLDNGAFSAWRQKKLYDFYGYREWAELWLKHPCVEWCVIPDRIDGTEADNDDLLKAWDLPKALSVPVYHYHESLERLEMLVSEWPRVALGSSGEYATPGTTDWWARTAEIMRVACDKDGMPRAKLHGLRMLDPVIFSHIPLSTADSCNASRNIGIDSAWNGTYTPASKATRAIVMMERIESHASAHRWCARSSGVQHNLELLG